MKTRLIVVVEVLKMGGKLESSSKTEGPKTKKGD